MHHKFSFNFKIRTLLPNIEKIIFLRSFLVKILLVPSSLSTILISFPGHFGIDDVIRCHHLSFGSF